MFDFWYNTHKEGRQALMAIVAVVVAAYITAGFNAWGDYQNGRVLLSAFEWIVLVVLGCIYLWILMNDAVIPSPRPQADVARFLAVALTILYIISYLFQDYSMTWLMTFPLFGAAVEFFSGWRRMLAYVAIIGAFIVPLLIRFGLNADYSGMMITLVPAYIFVVAFTKLQLKAEQARDSAETLATDLEKANIQLAEYATQAEELATTKERNRLAREIHDNLGHYLTVVNVQLEAAKLIVNKDPEKAQSAIQKAQRMTQEGLQSVRQSVGALRENAMANRSIPEAIAQLIEDTKTRGLETDYQVQGEPRKLEPKAALTLYRVAQEGLTNIRKHAQASQVDLVLDYTTSNEVRLMLKDNGIGATETESGFGLLGIRERINLLGGNMDVETGPNKGFRLAVALPG